MYLEVFEPICSLPPFWFCFFVILAYLGAMVLLDLIESLIGKILYKLGFKKAGHYLVAMSSWYDIWLLDNCPYYMGQKCRAWTCPAYDKNHCHLCKKDEMPF